MRKLLATFVALIGLSLVAVDVDARRMGGGRSVGKQREAISPQQATPRTPAQQAQPQAPQNTPAQAAPAAAAAKPASGMSRWLGPLAGLAIGAGLASLFFNNGMGGALMGMLLLAALVFGAVMLFRLFRGSRRPEPLRYAGAGAYGQTEPIPAQAPAPAPAAPSTFATPAAAAPHSVAATTSGVAPAATTRWPADFNADEFLKQAKPNFIKLQAAHDRKDLGAIRDFLTPELTREIEADIRASGDTPQKTEVVTLDAQVLDVAPEGGLYVVSVRFSGLIRESEGGEPQPFSEIWHLEKPMNGRSGWLVAGIQQA
jgi:predicted lipid-binding transport protein (Tim44 family)